ncbi:MAG: L-seryl-tRNA(Sec) selenium transferase [Victivallales bacterium]|nr:L-seryl-tRNA(Sec) selenium transferase [Victivallales bacterium]
MASDEQINLLQQLPAVEEVLQHNALSAIANIPRDVVVDAVRGQIDSLRQSILAGGTPGVDVATVAQAAAARAAALHQPSLRRVINASGVIIHTNLGRSVLAPEAVEAVNQAITGYSTLEYSTERMERGSRHEHCETLICALTGAEAGIAVNNNAAAVMMVLSTFAADHEAIVSRGEQIEIGGSFRIPDIMQQSHARMIEVGTTNKTHPTDYENALSEDTAMVLKVHPSNYRMTGFTESVSIAQLRQIADARKQETGQDILVYEDQGSGAFLRFDVFGTYAEPTVDESLAAGADLVSFSGDKLLGGPQAGIIVGRKDLIERLKKSPLARVLRLDKMTLAALEATLRLYLQPELAVQSIPTARMLTEDANTVKQRAEQLHAAVAAKVPENLASLSLVEEISRAGGGALPMCDIATYALEVQFKQGSAQSCEEFLVQQCPIPIVARISQDKLLFDARTLLHEDELTAIASGLAAYFAQLEGAVL